MYRLLSGDILQDMSYVGERNAALLSESTQSSESIVKDLDWLVALASIFWFSEEEGGQMLRSLERFHEALYFGHAQGKVLVQTPQMPHTHGVATCYNALYSLLWTLCADETDPKYEGDSYLYDVSLSKRSLPVLDCVNPTAFSSDLLDYRGPYIVLCLLESVHRGRYYQTTACVRQHVISQLISRGLWTHALFVASQLPDEEETVPPHARDLLRRTTVRDILMHRSQISQAEFDFVVHKLKIPKQWVFESQFYSLNSSTIPVDRNSKIERLLNLAGKLFEAEMYSLCIDKICLEIAPVLLENHDFSFKADNGRLKRLLCDERSCDRSPDDARRLEKVKMMLRNLNQKRILDNRGRLLLTFLNIYENQDLDDDTFKREVTETLEGVCNMLLEGIKDVVVSEIGERKSLFSFSNMTVRNSNSADSNYSEIQGITIQCRNLYQDIVSYLIDLADRKSIPVSMETLNRAPICSSQKRKIINKACADRMEAIK